MRVLGIHDGHTSTVCLFEDGKVIHNVSEERFTKVKGQGGFPFKAIEYVLKASNIIPDDIDKIGLVGFVKPLTSIKEYTEGRQSLFPKIVKNVPIDPRGLIKTYVKNAKSKRLRCPDLQESFKKSGLDINKVELMEHHQTHASTAYYMSKYYQKDEKCLVFTLDGSGDGLGGSISIVDENGKWDRKKEISSFDSLGIVYGRATQLLAMKPWEHEFKLMGMAPYANKEYTKKSFAIFQKFLRLSKDGLGFENPTRYWGNSLLDAMRKEFKTTRFDSVSAGVQKLHEDLVTDLVGNWIKKTGVKNIACAGGCFMNIKANKNLMELPEVENIFVMPSGGDESCALGACLQIYNDDHEDITKNEELLHLYWGPDNEEDDILSKLKTYDDIEFKKESDIEMKTAELLADHKIIGRVSGRMEWGARALGNRSIVANPTRTENLRDLNVAIKMRDFWMPFAPSILWEDRKEYGIYLQENDSYLMTIGFDSTELAKEHLKAAVHPYDLSMRPQFVRADYNPKYHKMISNFKELTGVSGVLNTSFNLHGMPIVNDTEDAIYTLKNSDLDFVTINDYLVWKKK
jgi:carbamoyltransferase